MMKKISKKRKKKVLMYVLLCIACLYTLFPLLYAFSASLRSDVELYKYVVPFSWKTLFPVDITFDSYRRIFTEFGFAKAIGNTFLLVLILVPCGCIINSVAAFAFTFFDFKYKDVLFALFLVSFMIPFESIAIPLYGIVNKLGWVDTRYAMIVPSIANGLVLFLFKQFFQDIPVGFIEAARLDGASWLKIYAKVVMPMSVPVFITAGLMQFVAFWNAYLWPLLVARSKEIRTIQIALAAFKMEESTLWSCLYAGSVLSALIPLALFLPFQKYFVDGITSSGIKG